METPIGNLFEADQAFKPNAAVDLMVKRFRLVDEQSGAFESAFSRILAAAYIMPLERDDPAGHPDLPPPDNHNVLLGDFGEALAAAIYNQLIPDYTVPASKLWGKPNPGTSQTGEDNVGLLISSTAEMLQPVTVESKVRTGRPGPKTLLDLFEQPPEDRAPMRRAAWRNAVNSLSNVQSPKREYALRLAEMMYGLSLPGAQEPDYLLHGFLVVEPGQLSEDEIRKIWGLRGDPPVSRLVIVEIDELEQHIKACFDRARNLTIGDLRPHPDEFGLTDPPKVTVGLSAPVSVDAADPPELTCPVSQAALWFLADRDGLGLAASGPLIGNSDVATRSFARLLAGRLPLDADIDELELHEFVNTVKRTWHDPADDLLSEVASLTDEAARWAHAHPNDGDRLRLVAATIAYRLDRHPKRLTASSTPPGAVLTGTLARLSLRNIVAFWPPQAKALAAGLLTESPGPFVISMPTSAGKTLLIALSVARALDSNPDEQVIVLANTRALVRHLRSELGFWLPGVETTSLLGEIDHIGDTCFPSDGPRRRVVLTTPERFDLDWRRASTDSEAEIDPSAHTSLVVVDEAHHITDVQRGAKLEVGLSRALRRNIPVQMFSSQLGDSALLTEWLGADEVLSSDWRPADVHRHVFYRSDNDSRGWIWPEGEEPMECMTMPGTRVNRSDPTLALKKTFSMVSALALAREPDGLVMIYTPTKSGVDSLARAVKERALASTPNWQGGPELEGIADRLPPAAEECEKLLRLGIGVHHASTSKFEHWAIEEAASKGLLRYLVCTDTLLSGVDFPVRSVIAANSTRNQRFLPAALLNNLAGRAGRGGRFYSGDLLLVTTNLHRAKQLFHYLAAELPPTRSQLDRAVNVLLRVRDAVAITDKDAAALRDYDSFLLAAIAEAAVEQGDLRLELEAALCRTLWWAGAAPGLRDNALTAAVSRASLFQNSPEGWNRVVYRTGLDRSVCGRIRELLDDLDTDSLAALARDDFGPTSGGDHLVSLALVAAQIDPTGRPWPRELDEPDIRGRVVRAWLSGLEAPTDLPGSKVEVAFDQLANHGSWVVGAALEVIRWKHALTSSEIAQLAAKLELARLPTGTPSEGAATLVEAGLPRTEAAQLWQQYVEDPFADGDFLGFAKATLTPEVAEIMRWPAHDQPTDAETAQEPW